MLLFGFTIGGALLSHSIRLHVEMNTYNSWFNYLFEYSEETNGIILAFELFKIQLYLSIMSNCQDFWLNTHESYFVQQEHGRQPKLTTNNNDDIIE